MSKTATFQEFYKGMNTIIVKQCRAKKGDIITLEYSINGKDIKEMVRITNVAKDSMRFEVVDTNA